MLPLVKGASVLNVSFSVWSWEEGSVLNKCWLLGFSSPWNMFAYGLSLFPSLSGWEESPRTDFPATTN